MSIEARIKEIINRLSPEWFNAVKAEFENNPFYNKGSGMIDNAIEEYQLFWDPEIGEEQSEEKGQIKTILIQSTLPEYCWSGLPLTVTNINPEDGPIFKASSLTSEIIDSIEIIFTTLTDLRDKHDLIVSAVQYMLEEANSLKVKLNDPNYHDTIDNCISQFRYEISKRYGVVKSAHDTVSEFQDKLYFDMSKKELAVLLAILVDAGFINGSTEKHPVFQHFFNKYFYFKNQLKGNSFTRAVDIHKKMSDVHSRDNADYIKIVPKIKDKLLEAIKNL